MRSCIQRRHRIIFQLMFLSHHSNWSLAAGPAELNCYFAKHSSLLNFPPLTKRDLHFLNFLLDSLFIMFRMMRAVPRMANVRHATLKTQTIRAVSQKVSVPQAANSYPTIITRNLSVKTKEKINDDEAPYIQFFNRSNIDSWGIRKGMGDLAALDILPSTEAIAAALRACGRIGDLALGSRSRFLIFF